MGKILKDIYGMPLQGLSLLRPIGNRLPNEELDYDIDDNKRDHEKY